LRLRFACVCVPLCTALCVRLCACVSTRVCGGLHNRGRPREFGSPSSVDTCTLTTPFPAPLLCNGPGRSSSSTRPAPASSSAGVFTPRGRWTRRCSTAAAPGTSSTATRCGCWDPCWTAPSASPTRHGTTRHRPSRCFSLSFRISLLLGRLVCRRRSHRVPPLRHLCLSVISPFSARVLGRRQRGQLPQGRSRKSDCYGSQSHSR